MLLYYITDRSQFGGDETSRRHALLAKIAEAVRAGVDYIQLREKDLTAHELEGLAREAVRTLHDVRRAAPGDQRPATRLLINSRADIAIAVNADGVHLRGDDISPVDVRRVWSQLGAGAAARDRPVIAISCHTHDDVVRAQSKGVDFAVFAPVFEKMGASPVGLAALSAACKGKIPLLALGGVTLDNAPACLAAGAAGIGGIRLFQDNEIASVVRALRGGGEGDAARRDSTLT